MRYEPLLQQLLMHGHIVSRPESYVLADPGVGKTAATLMAIATLLSDFEIKGALIVAPLRVALLTWPAELAKYEEFSWIKLADLRTHEGRYAWAHGLAHIYTINYDMLQAFCKQTWGLHHRKSIPVDMVVWDEVSKIKAASGKRAKAFAPFRRFFTRHVGLTGTPAPNGLLDIFAQVRMLDGGKRLGASYTAYRDRYFESDYMGWKWTLRPGAKENIEKKIADMTITLRREDWMHLPPTTAEDIQVHLSAAVQKQYKELQKELLLQLDRTEIVALNAAVLVQKLLQFTSGAIYDADRVVSHVHDEKIKTLVKLAKQIGEPILVAANFIHEKQRIVAAIPGAEMFSNERLDAWNRGEIPCLVADPRSVGHGLNLQSGGSNVVWFSLTYSRELFDQMNARLIRTGQSKPTTIWRLMVPGTVDEVVAEVLRVKGDGQAELMLALSYLQKINKYENKITRRTAL